MEIIKKISIVTSYYNRKKLFLETVKSIIKTKHTNYELIVVDDGSDENERLENIVSFYPFIKLIRIESKDKWYVNPCIPFNLGIKEVSGEIIILQNPECLHVNDILSYTNTNLTEDNYLTFSCYALNKELTNKLPFLINNNFIQYFNSLPQQESKGNPTIGWYNHSKIRPTYYHFCSAITRTNLVEKLNGFDERYALGISYDDNELLDRINRLGLKKEIIDNISVIHQWHPSIFYNRKDFNSLHLKNKSLYFDITKNETLIKSN
jgi:GT2 family glycosyltransferase